MDPQQLYEQIRQRVLDSVEDGDDVEQITYEKFKKHQQINLNESEHLEVLEDPQLKEWIQSRREELKASQTSDFSPEEITTQILAIRRDLSEVTRELDEIHFGIRSGAQLCFRQSRVAGELAANNTPHGYEDEPLPLARLSRDMSKLGDEIEKSETAIEKLKVKYTNVRRKSENKLHILETLLSSLKAEEGSS